jgi:hypothetical protein
MRIFLLLLALTGCAHAQFGVSVSLPRTTFMALEAIPATVTVVNRTGADIVLGGPGRSSWLSFEMTDKAGHPLAPIDVAADDVVQIPAGGTINRTIVVTDAFAPTERGNYSLTARVMHQPTKEYYSSNRARFSITDAKPMWEQTFGVPEGFKDVGKVRRYTMSVLRETEKTMLFFRLIDEATAVRIETLSLGPISMVFDPQITLDRTNRLQVLYLVMPKIFCHVIIQPDGKLLQRAYYQEVNQSRPRLLLAENGDVSVSGGEFFDPTAPPKEKTKGVSERPPGL